MTDPRLDDHLAGLEQELVELVERRERALVQRRHDDAAALQEEIDSVQAELVATAEASASATAEPPARVTVEASGAEPPRAAAQPWRWTWRRRSVPKHA